LSQAATNQFSGYLLRKYRTSSGWQRLWVVLAAFTLFFYKDYTECAPMASLNLIDYNVTLPLVSDGISKSNVFKLSYLKHSYFFRAENLYEFSRWIEVIRTATQNNTANDVFANLITKAV
uniref:PH domain-containing protein n=1 Tax=Syphacia muris TaxID=451379 RepID=A0A0N5APR5_9BILA